MYEKVQEEIISNFYDVFEIVEDKYNKGFTFFRGHSDENYRLNSTIYRNLKEKDIGRKLQEVYEKERNLYEEFNIMGYKFIPPHFNSWDKLMLMQHYGSATRLLDWTENFSIALYFAFEKYISSSLFEENKRPSIYMLNPKELNIHKFRAVLFDDKEEDINDRITFFNMPKKVIEYENYFKMKNLSIPSFALHPSKNNDRLISQSGVFTVQCKLNTTFSLEEEAPKTLFKIIFDRNSFESAIYYLKYCDINRYRVYNDIDNLSKHITSRL